MKRRRVRWPWILLILAIAFWFAHEPVLVWGLRKAVGHFGRELGLKLEFASVRLHLFQPVEFRDVRFVVVNPPVSETDVAANSIRITTNSAWRMLFGDGRVLEALEVDELRGTFDFRPEAIIPQPLPEFPREEQRKISALILRFLPVRIDVKDSDATFLAENQSYAVRGVSGVFDEARSGLLSVKEALIEAGSIRQTLENDHAVTAWKNGVMYLSDLRLRDEVVIRDFAANYVNPGGVSLDADIGAYGGTIRLNVAFGAKNDLVYIDAAASVVNLPVEPLPELLAFQANARGTIRDGRFMFRGNPERVVDAEMALRLAAEEFQWNERGWQSLVVGANYIGRRLYLSTFDLTQADNRISLNGEVSIPEQIGQLGNSRFLANLSADVKDLRQLAALAGPGFDEIAGRLYLHGSLSGEEGEIDGYLNGEASGIEYKGLAPASSKVSLVVRGDSLDVRSAELWSGEDRVVARGTIGLRGSHRYSGEITGTMRDLGLYAPHVGEAVANNVFTGAASFQWQGDGTMTAHSGAFRVKLEDVATTLTPTGLTGEFEGTYSPENIYFNTVRLTHGQLELNTRLTIAAGGVNLSDVELRRGELRILGGEAFVPLNVFSLASGGTIADALNTRKPVYADLRSGELSVSDLSRMAGQEVSVSGTVKFDLSASGLLPDLKLAGSLTGRRLAASFEDFSVPTTAIDVTFGSTEKQLAARGTVAMEGFQPLQLEAGMPFGYEKMEDGGIRLFKPDAPLHAQLKFPEASLEIFKPWLPEARRITGTIGGRLNVKGTINAPDIDGEVTLRDGNIEINPTTPHVTALNGRATFRDSRLTIESFRGEVGAGPFEITGWAEFSDPEQPELQLALKGSKVLLARDPGFRLRADLDLTARGRGNSGELSGSVRLVDGRVFRRLEVTPFLVRNPENPAGFEAPSFGGLVPPPYADWKLNVSITNAMPFLLMGNLATGEISPDMSLSGTLGAPYPAGTIHLKNLQAYLPASTLLIPDGRIYFTQRRPFMPVMDVRARSEVSGYNVQMYAYGALSEANLALRSDPPLSQENLVALLTTGIVPAGLSGAGFGEAAVGQGGVILLRSIARQIEPLGIDLNEFVNRLTVNVVPPRDPSQMSSLESRLRLNDQFSISTGRDGFGFYNAGVQYTIKLQ